MNLIAEELCTGCGACASVCPRNCIDIVQGNYGFFVPKINGNSCIECGLCKINCHVTMPHTDKSQCSDYYSLWDLDETKRISGSSGGFFGRLAEWVIEHGGVVYGASFDDNCRNLTHKSTKTETLDKLKKSKYVESKMDQTIKHIIYDLKEGKYVLFCGTPCQTMGVRGVLKNKYDRLILCDFLCHGVPSQAIYDKYLNQIETIYNKKIVEVLFRSKIYGWKAYAMLIRFSDGTSYKKLAKEDPYLNLFFSSNANRPSCSGCNRAKFSDSDFTMGDYWNVRNNTQIKDDDKGISLLAVRTDLGRTLFKELIKDLHLCTLKYKDVAYAFVEKKCDNNTRLKTLPKISHLSMIDKIKCFVIKSRLLRKLIYRVI